MAATRRLAAFCLLTSLIPAVSGGCQANHAARVHALRSRSIEPTPTTISLAAMPEARFTHQHQFYYYPNAGVYRDCDENRWFWSNDGGVTWIIGAQLPAQRDCDNEIPFVVHLAANEPSVQHTSIASAYPADTESAVVQGSIDRN